MSSGLCWNRLLGDLDIPEVTDVATAEEVELEILDILRTLEVLLLKPLESEGKIKKNGLMIYLKYHFQ